MADPGGIQRTNKVGGEVQRCGRGGNRAFLAREHRLVIGRVLSVRGTARGDIGRERHAAGAVEYQIDSQLLNCGGLGAFGLAPLFWGADGQTLWYTTAREGGPDGACRPWVRPMTRVDVTDWSVVTLDQAATVFQLGGILASAAPRRLA